MIFVMYVSILHYCVACCGHRLLSVLQVSGQTKHWAKTGESQSRSDTMTVLLTDWPDTFTHSGEKHT